MPKKDNLNQDSDSFNEYIKNGDECFEKEDLNGAIRWYEKAFQVGPDNISALGNLGNLPLYQDNPNLNSYPRSFIRYPNNLH